MRLLCVLAGLLSAAILGEPVNKDAAAAAADKLSLALSDVSGSSDKLEKAAAAVEDTPSKDDKAKRSPIAATAVYGASPQHHGQYVIRHGDDAPEVGPEYLALLQQYLVEQPEPQHQIAGRQQHQRTHLHQQPERHYQNQPIQRVRIGALLEQELVKLIEKQPVQHKQAIPLDVEQYHVETTAPRRVPAQALVQQHQYQPQLQQHQQQLYYPVEEVQIPARAQPQHHHHQIQHHQAAAAAAAAAQQHQHQQQQVVVSHHRQPQPQAQVHQHVQVTPEPITIQHPDEVQHVVRPQPQSLRYHQSIPIQYGYEDEQQVQHQQQSPESIVRAQQSAEQQALAFHKIAQAAHYKHQDDALEQIRVANEKHRQQSALEQIKQGEQVSEAGRQERVQPKDPEGAYKAHLKAQATALVAEHRRAHEAAEYKAHADAILKLQAQQQAHLRAQEEAHRYALNFEKNQARAQAQAQAIANAQALALYNAHKAARAKAQQEAKQAAKAQHDAKKLDPDNAPVVQYLLPNKVPLPAPEEYLPKAAEALRESALQEKRLKQQQKAAAVAQQQHHHQHQHQAQPIKHQQQQIFEIDPNLLRGFPAKLDEQTQELTFLVDADYFRKIQAQQRGEASEQQPARAVLRPASRYQSIEEEPAQRQQHQHQTAHRYQSYHHSGQINPDKIALLVPVEPQQP
ncbi:hypothetical protein TKK_0006891 [Trichogramma kaykai]|uniref:Uncharacterized protein n=1 Tax=Trichogramma kaykai TaxID=54128 RepID=A0ABD2XB36_9HYME